MVIADPIAELLTLTQRVGLDPPSRVDRRSAELLRRQFGIALPPPFAHVGGPPAIRPASGIDIPAVGAIYLRSGSDVASSTQLISKMIERSKEPGVVILVAGRPGSVVGVGALVPGADPWVMVDRTAQGAGLDEALRGALAEPPA